MNAMYNKEGVLSFWIVCPSPYHRNLAHRKLREKYPELNYCVEWKDVQGAGLHMTVVDWLAEGQFYHASNTKKTYEVNAL